MSEQDCPYGKSPLLCDRCSFGACGYTAAGLERMADYGASQVAKGRYDGLRFDLFNKAEADVVRDHMRSKYPAIPFQITRVA